MALFEFLKLALFAITRNKTRAFLKDLVDLTHTLDSSRPAALGKCGHRLPIGDIERDWHEIGPWRHWCPGGGTDREAVSQEAVADCSSEIAGGTGNDNGARTIRHGASPIGPASDFSAQPATASFHVFEEVWLALFVERPHALLRLVGVIVKFQRLQS